MDNFNQLKVNDEDPLPPLNVCPETVGYILSLGTLNELVVHQPENKQYKERQLEVEGALKKHLALCKKCRDALSEKPPE